MPIAADMGLLMFGAGWEVGSVASTLNEPIDALNSFLNDVSASLDNVAP